MSTLSLSNRSVRHSLLPSRKTGKNIISAVVGDDSIGADRIDFASGAVLDEG